MSIADALSTWDHSNPNRIMLIVSPDGKSGAYDINIAKELGELFWVLVSGRFGKNTLEKLEAEQYVSDSDPRIIEIAMSDL